MPRYWTVRLANTQSDPGLFGIIRPTTIDVVTRLMALLNLPPGNGAGTVDEVRRR